LQAAILSPLYKVRDFEVKEGLTVPITIGWMGSAADAQAGEGGDVEGERMTGNEGEYKTAVVFPVGAPLNTLKVLTFFRKGPFEIKAEYADTSLLVPGTRKELASYKVDLPVSADVKKVKVRARLSLSSMFSIEGAQLLEDEEYEDIVKEKRELPPDAGEDAGQAAAAAPAAAEGAAEAEGAPKAEGEAPKTEGEAQAKKEPEKKYEWVEVKTKKTRTKKTDIPVVVSNALGIPEPQLQKLCDLETAMQVEMAEIVETDERRNDLESHIFNMRDKCSESGEYGAFIASGVRDAYMSELTKAEDWLYDNFDATKVMYIDKLEELKKTSDQVVWRYKESQMRTDWVTALSGTISNYKSAAENPGDKYGHISPDKLSQIIKECNVVSAWLADAQSKQASVPKHEKPALLCADMEKKNQELAKFADDILKEPKPKPPAEEKKEEPAAGDDKKDAPKEEPAPKPAGDSNDVD